MSLDDLIYNSQYPWDIEEQAIKYWLGWNFIYSKEDMAGDPLINGPYFGYGLYKMWTSASNACFYFDYRDDRLKPYSPPVNGHPIDLWVKYDFDEQKFFLSSNGSIGTFTEIENHSILRLWEIKGKWDPINNIYPTTSEFPNFWENSLALINDGNNHPKLVWAPHPNNNNIQGYRIYKMKSHSQFSLLTTLSKSSLEYTDLEEEFPTYNPNNPIVNIQYKVVGVLSNNLETQSSNIVSTYVVGIPFKNGQNKTSSTFNHELSLNQNYPNPFNPSTRIDYSLKHPDYVKLIIFDNLGQEVKTLVNSFQVNGSYSVTLDLSNYPSGIYYYTLITSSKVISKKLSLIK